jgi:hypothetical protein
VEERGTMEEIGKKGNFDLDVTKGVIEGHGQRRTRPHNQNLIVTYPKISAYNVGNIGRQMVLDDLGVAAVSAALQPCEEAPDLLSQCSYSAVTVLLHCRYCYTVATLLFRFCYNVVTLWLHSLPCCWLPPR